LFFSIGIVLPVVSQEAAATITPFFNDLPGFNEAAGYPPIAINFDEITPGTNITGQTIQGVIFTAPGASLIVVRGTDTFTPSGFSGVINASTNKLFPTSGSNVLSPGGIELVPGPNSSIENDDLELRFITPVSAVGFDILYQSLDGASYTAVEIRDPDNELLYSNNFIPMPDIPVSCGSPGGPLFVGFVSDSNNIASIKIDEFDKNAVCPDSNIGYDTIRFIIPVFNTGEGTYPSISGIHNGAITPKQTINVSRMFTYSCPGTGGHSEYVWIYGNGINVNATWNGYQGAEGYHYIEFSEPFTLEANVTYNYTIKTGSYPQIHHTDRLEIDDGVITCDNFVDANGKVYTDWIPAIRLE